MDGSIVGNVMGVGYYLLFLIMGIFFAWKVFYKEKGSIRILTGSVIGNVAMMWMPCIFAFFFGFSMISHGIALCFTAVLFVLGMIFSKSPNHREKTKKTTFKRLLREHAYLFLILPVFFFFCFLLYTHTIPYYADGSMHTGQSTNGDMNMHLGFITSIANQQIFPPEYSILPGNKLSYPFLCDSISSSIYLFGSSLRVAYIVPMMIAFLQVAVGIVVLGQNMLKSRGKAILAWVFFIFNGGFGIYYFLKNVTKDTSVFTRIFTEFYQTPTNFADGNIRWSNVLVDLLLPQRATLFGWSVLIPIVYLLYRGIQQHKRSYFIAVGLLAGSLPMIHTHSFLAMGCICAMWLIYSMRSEVNRGWKNKESKIELIVLFVFFLVMCSFDALRRKFDIPTNVYLILALLVVVAIVILCVYLGIRGIRTNGKDSLIWNWLLLLGIVVILALPQLFFWTFSQANGEQFVRGCFNWANLDDTYLGFYFKNMGIVWIIGIVALIFTRTRNYFMVAPAFFIWTLVELVAFQPNEYDNNKLLYIAYLFFCFFVADYIVELVKKFHSKAVKTGVIACIVLISSISALLTMGREVVSDYELYSADEVEMCKFIETSTEPTDVILTDTRYNNGVAALTGRNIVCGSDSFLYFHGLSYMQQAEDVMNMYRNPANMPLYDLYQVKYVYVSDSERATYGITDEAAFAEEFEIVHQIGEVTLYRNKKLQKKFQKN